MRILIVDDHHRVREALATDLALFGHEVAEAANGAEALLAIERRRPDVLVTDLDMPRMNGAELMAEARRTHPGLPIVLMSADYDALGAIADPDCRLHKPFTTTQLLGAIERVRAS